MNHVILPIIQTKVEVLQLVVTQGVQDGNEFLGPDDSKHG